MPDKNSQSNLEVSNDRNQNLDQRQYDSKQAHKAIFYFFTLIVVFLFALVLFNYHQDPLCYFHCAKIESDKTTENIYYEAAQDLLFHKDAELLVLGSSRGERVPVKWLSEFTGLKTLNLSRGGADLPLKIALSNFAIRQQLPIKKILWLVDYFEFVSSTTSAKIKFCPALQELLPASLKWPSNWKARAQNLQILLDHNTFEASLALFKKKPRQQTQSNNEDDAMRTCSSDSFVGPKSDSILDSEIANTYPSFSKLLLQPLDQIYLKEFENQILKLSELGISVVVNIAPYNPKFESRLRHENPTWQSSYQAWVEKIKSLHGKNVEVLDHSPGIPKDNGLAQFWEDGVHPTCFGDFQMLQKMHLDKN